MSLKPEAVDWVFDCEWIEDVEDGKMGDYYIDETYRLKEGAPEDIRRRWEDLCALDHSVVDIQRGLAEP
jgi:hypothetical protein